MTSTSARCCLVLALFVAADSPSSLSADDFSSDIVIELFRPDTSRVEAGDTVVGPLTGKVTIRNSVTQHAQFYKNFRVIHPNEPGPMIDSPAWVRTFTLDTTEFYDGENLISVHVHPHNTPEQPYISDFSVQAFRIVTANDNPAPSGDVRLPTISIDATIMGLRNSVLMQSKSLYTDYDAVSVFDDGVKIDVDQHEYQSNKAQVIPHLGASVLGRFRWTDRTLPFGDSLGRLITRSNLVNFQTDQDTPARIVFFLSDASGRANYGFYDFTLPALSPAVRRAYPLPSTNATILNVSQGDEIVIPDDDVFTLKVEITNPRLLGNEYTTLSTWVGNRSVAATDVTPLLRNLPADETRVVVNVDIPASEIQKLQDSRDGGPDSTAFALWNDFDRFRDSNLPVSGHVHLSSIRTMSYPWPHGDPTVKVYRAEQGKSPERHVTVGYAVYGDLIDADRLFVRLNDADPVEIQSFTGAQVASTHELSIPDEPTHTVTLYLTDSSGRRLPHPSAHASIDFPRVSVDNAPLAPSL